MFCTYCGSELAGENRFCPQCGKANSLEPGPDRASAPPPKRLALHVAGKKIGGVCAGFAKYLEWDVTLVRLLFILGLIFYFATAFIYLVCWLVMPRDDEASLSSAL